MRSVLSVRVVVAVAATVLAVLLTTAVVARPPRAAAYRPPATTLAAAVDRTLAAGSARLAGTATSPDGTSVDLEGITSFATPDAVLFARSGPAEEAIEVRTTSTGSWLRSPSLGGWIELEATSALTPTSADGWADVLARLRHAPSPQRSGRRFDVEVEDEPVVVHVNDDGRIRRIRLERHAQVIDVTFSDFGVTVDVDPPDDAVPAEP